MQVETVKRLDNIDRQLLVLTETINLARGGLRMLVILGTASAAIVTVAISAWNALVHHQ